ncbi:hypothetical protein QTP86_034264, partial [Hemibagrus guttatus]
QVEEQYDADLQRDPTGIWLKDGTKPNVNKVFNSKVTTENKIEGEIIGDLLMKNCTTIFYNISERDRGDYYFRIETTGLLKNTYRPSVSLRVRDSPISPSITLYKEDQGEVEDQNEVVEGTSVSLICSAPSPCLLKPPTFTWNFLPEERRQEQNHNTSFSSSQLNFNATHLHHGLTFTCTTTYQLQNQNKSAQSSRTLHVLYGPRNTSVSASPSASVLLGSSVSLSCSSDANPAVLNYTWYRENGEQIGTGNHLTINTTDSTHRGLYYCRAQNQHGDHNSSVVLDVQYAPQVSPSSSCNSTQELIMCSCEVHGNPSPKLEWSVSGQTPSTIREESVNYTTSRSFISIHQSFTDMFTLQCVGSNTLGTDTQLLYFKKVPHPSDKVCSCFSVISPTFLTLDIKKEQGTRRGRWGEQEARRGKWGERGAKARQVGGARSKGEESVGSEEQRRGKWGERGAKAKQVGGARSKSKASGGSEGHGGKAKGSAMSTAEQRRRATSTAEQQSQATSTAEQQSRETSTAEQQSQAPSTAEQQSRATSTTEQQSRATTSVQPGRKPPRGGGEPGAASNLLRRRKVRRRPPRRNKGGAKSPTGTEAERVPAMKKRKKEKKSGWEHPPLTRSEASSSTENRKWSDVPHRNRGKAMYREKRKKKKRAEEELERGESSGCLGSLLDGEEDVGKEELPVPSFFVLHPVQHPLEGLIEALHKSISLRVVNRRPQVHDLCWRRQQSDGIGPGTFYSLVRYGGFPKESVSERHRDMITEFSISLPESVEALRGLCVLIPCSFQIKEQYDADLQRDPTGIWLKDGTDVNRNKVFNSKVTTENKIEGEIIGDLLMKNCTTIFYNIRERDRGDYYFRIETTGLLKITYRPSVSLRVRDSPISPSITLYKEDQGEVEDQNEVVEGTSVSLICSAPSPCLLKPPTFTWNFLPEERRQEQNHNTSFSSSQLNFTATHLHHGLTFTCTTTYQLQNQNKSAQSSRTLHVLYGPRNMSVSASPSASVLLGSSVSLSCSSDANPAVLNYTWYRENGEQIGTGNHLTINTTDSTHRGLYYCRAQNQHGDHNSSVVLDVQYGPRNMSVSASPSASVLLGSSVSLSCSSDANPAVLNYTWYRENGEQIGTGNHLTINTTDSTHRGLYYCRAQNQHGDHNSSVVLDVQYGPRNTSVSASPSASVLLGSSVSLSCSSDANPAVLNYTWYRENGEQIGTGNHLTINTTDSTHRGLYYCRAQNQHGDHNSSVVLDVQYAPQVSPFSSCNSTQELIMCSCEVHGNPSPKLEWSLSGETLSLSETTNIRQELVGDTCLRSFLNISIQKSVNDSHSLQCVGANKLGVASQLFSSIKNKAPCSAK